MLPPRADIGAPEFPRGLDWIGQAPASMAELAAPGPVLVHFIDFAQLNSVRTLPYLTEWHRRYRDLDLAVIAVQAPRLPFGAERDATVAAVDRLGLKMPVAIDTKRQLWQDYGCEGWPSLFLWAQGAALRWFHFGEGEYRATEEAIQAELRELDALRMLPEPMAPVRPEDEPGATVIGPTPEFFPAVDRAWTAERDDPDLVVEYEAGGSHVTVEGEGTIQVELDGQPQGLVRIEGPGVYELARHARHGRHRVQLTLSGGVSLWSLSFSAGLPAS